MGLQNAAVRYLIPLLIGLGFYWAHIHPIVMNILAWLWKKVIVIFVLLLVINCACNVYAIQEQSKFMGDCAYDCNLNVLLGHYDPTRDLLQFFLSETIRPHLFKTRKLFHGCGDFEKDSVDETIQQEARLSWDGKTKFLCETILSKQHMTYRQPDNDMDDDDDTCVTNGMHLRFINHMDYQTKGQRETQTNTLVGWLWAILTGVMTKYNIWDMNSAVLGIFTGNLTIQPWLGWWQTCCNDLLYIINIVNAFFLYR
jgi:hypothetical protein